MRSAFDFSPFRRSTVGFDRLFDMLESSTLGQTGENYPPFDLIKLGDNEYRIELAVAGFKPEELNVEVKENTLTVSGRKSANDEARRYLHRGLAERNFERRFQLADYVYVTDAQLADGLLSISLKRELPEAMKPRRIDINTGAQQQVIEGQATAA